MRIRAIRGVCIGSERHLKPDEEVTIDEATARYLIAIGAVAAVVEIEPRAVTAPAVSATVGPEKPEPMPIKGVKKKEE